MQIIDDHGCACRNLFSLVPGEIERSFEDQDGHNQVESVENDLKADNKRVFCSRMGRHR